MNGTSRRWGAKLKGDREQPISYEEAMRYVVVTIGRDGWRPLRDAKYILLGAHLRPGNDEVVVIAGALKKMTRSMRTLRLAAKPRAGVTKPFSGPVTSDHLDELGRQLTLLVAAYDTARPIAALAVKANQRLDQFRVGKLKPLRRSGGKFLRPGTLRAFIGLCREANPDLPQDPAFWMHLAIAMQFDPPLLAGGEERAARRREWFDALKG
jgi:hypothetical protein